MKLNYEVMKLSYEVMKLSYEVMKLSYEVKLWSYEVKLWSYEVLGLVRVFSYKRQVQICSRIRMHASRAADSETSYITVSVAARRISQTAKLDVRAARYEVW
jgi:hypothetical protein